MAASCEDLDSERAAAKDGIMSTSTHPVHKALASHTDPKGLPWVPWAAGHFIKLIKLNPITGQIILFIRSVPGAALQMHFHPGTVVFTPCRERGLTTKAGFRKRATWFLKLRARHIRRAWWAGKIRSCL